MKCGERTFIFDKPVYVRSGYTIVGDKEGKGNYGNYFDVILADDIWGQKSYERAECKMHKEAVLGAMQKAGIDESGIGLMLAGDLMNEIVGSSFAARDFNCGFMGLYNACATFGEALLLGSMLISAGYEKYVTCSSSSHFSTAERQYRYPLELGTQRTPTSQWTVTGAGCTVLSAEPGEEDFPLVTSGTIGRVIDMGVEDEANMGGAMAPAAADTIITHLRDTKRDASYYDLILTGDLGKYGKELLLYILNDEGYSGINNLQDCGAIYFKDNQKTEQGGSGAGCANTLFNGYFLKKMLVGEYSKILFVPTGALLSRDTPLQKETIPSIAHAVSFELK
ncbi:MAG: stage V sporulation protein AD [Christensenellales bacterium]